MIRIRYDIFYLDRQTIKESNMSKRTIYLTIDELALVLLTGQGLSTRQHSVRLCKEQFLPQQQHRIIIFPLEKVSRAKQPHLLFSHLVFSTPIFPSAVSMEVSDEYFHCLYKIYANTRSPLSCGEF